MPGAAQLRRGAAGRDDLDAELGKRAREVDQAALVGDAQQRALDLEVAAPAGSCTATDAFACAQVSSLALLQDALVHVHDSRIVGVEA